MREIGIRQLKNETSALIEQVEHGEVLTVTRRGRPVARVVPAGMSPGIAQLVETGRVRWSGRKPALPPAVELRGDGPTAAEMVIDDRGDR
ncbi:type II toxin-antitoxin system Phd/YefM family antitoxin [Conexibacter woesei]|uniref:Antitoxin n=1 Tax=Conexibacter woesei (strain DSM 14684 / CCUG 47730 / CIP 108061 / JCM 11494 / NBRC 100937 / ID131577) TaxID=469383 RepID=D3F570_CONWI|nr:type II toxin-antitoxin system prevent-host-death family antitoxin [Conexibacter woesei]ADB48648.1 prevent-host-death family protein [Conexibacter woesei DSM 14684]